MASPDLWHNLSRLFIWGFEGTSVSPALRTLFRTAPPGGVVLFRRNLESASQILSLTKELKGISPGPLLIGIDEEGGRVTRLPRPFKPLPPAGELGGEGVQSIRKRGKALGRTLRRMGINCDFAPVLDVNSNPNNPIIGDRAFSDHPEMAGMAAIAFYRGLHSAGVVACGKHFPGHGDTRSDSHLTLPRVTRPKGSLEKTELVPFRMAIGAEIPMMMTAHVVYPAWDKKRPATLSKRILTGLLRRRLKFRGVVITDDLEMKAISRNHNREEASLLALEAGSDLLLVCKNGEGGAQVVETIFREVSRSQSLKRRVEESFLRLGRLMKRYRF